MIFQSPTAPMAHSILKNQHISKKFVQKIFKNIINDIIHVYYTSPGNELLKLNISKTKAMSHLDLLGI